MRRFVRSAALVVGWCLLAVALGMFAVRQIGVTEITFVALVVGSPYLGVATIAALLLFAAARSRIGSAVAAVVTVAVVGVQVPMFLADGPNNSGPDLSVLTVNVAHGDADAGAIVDGVRDHDVDVLAVQELTPEEVVDLQDAGLDDLLPFSFTAALPVADGTGLWSRTPLTDGTRLDDFGFVPVQANTVVDGTALTLVSFHSMSPATPRHTTQWDADLARMRAIMDTYDNTVIVAGDFNATDDHRQFRTLASAPFSDAADAAGAGLFRTFPSERPLARLDHVVTSDSIRARSVQPLPIPESDHLAVLATVQLP
ncbi:endonuclease/exonuclease/phosphatase family protein [Rhodococcus sp. IEGM 1354]|uniref:endonuclease/exonuclease/phosphatase family protein n=1 Tax=Rhodococcus sp. IEGM 1354 TaxID=3047088 RepID=UPI0024B6F3DB|nr:endonuclease/exonuclease/phosphatase family protein [Rhodococcus sp. IEGM 1354]MDI9929605.1 endonuclease/exonuclease/phosphatase family protein [Rhodococcus sp. IEGM 1354]